MTTQLSFTEGCSIIVACEAPELRPYQARAIDEIQALVSRGVRRILLVLPTGAGKTIIATSVMRDVLVEGARCLFIAHRKELIEQCAIALARWGIARVGVIRADDRRTDAGAPVQVASIDTLRHRDKPDAQVIFVDECHRSMAAGYREHIFAAYPNAIIIGLTATPVRSDNQGLGENFEEMVIGATYSELIESGSIVAPKVFQAVEAPDLSGVRVQVGEYAPGALERAMSRPKLIGDLVTEWQRLASDRPTLLFAAGVEHSKQIVERFEAEGVRAAHVDGTTPDEERRMTWMNFRLGKIAIVSNVGIATEGTDIPECKCVVLARPTKSLALYMQMCGRAMRPHGDLRPLILDHASAADEHGLPHEDRAWNLTTGLKEKPLGVRTCPKCFAVVRARESKCTECGEEFPKGAGREAPVEAAGTLTERAPMNREEAVWFKLVDKAVTLGFKPGWASVQWKEEFGRWPPWAWTNEVRAMLANDSEWQRRIDDRAALRARFQKSEGA